MTSANLSTQPSSHALKDAATAEESLQRGRARPSKRSAGKPSAQHQSVPWLACWTIFLCLLPFYVEIAGLLLSPLRVAAIVLVPYLFVKLLTTPKIKFNAIDTLIILHFVAMILVTIIHIPQQWITYTFSNGLQYFLGYLLGRLCIRSAYQMRVISKLFIALAIIAIPFAFYENMTSNPVILRFFASLPGVTAYAEVDYPARLSLFRAQWVFPHPIHFGLFCAMGFVLGFVGLRHHWSKFKRLILSGLVAFSCFLSVSSGPFLSIVIQAGLVLTAHLTRKWKNRVRKILSVTIPIYIIGELLSDRLFIYSIIEKVTFNKSTANIRLVLLEYGLEQILKTPILGVGFIHWLPDWMSGSTDNYWLTLAVIFGLPCFFFFTAAFLVSLYRVYKNKNFATREEALFRQAWLILMIALAFVIATVAIWGTMTTLFMFMLGCGSWLMDNGTPNKSLTARLREKQKTSA